MILLLSGTLTIISGTVVFLVVTMILVGALLYAKAKLVPVRKKSMSPSAGLC